MHGSVYIFLTAVAAFQLVSALEFNSKRLGDRKYTVPVEIPMNISDHMCLGDTYKYADPDAVHSMLTGLDFVQKHGSSVVSVELTYPTIAPEAWGNRKGKRKAKVDDIKAVGGMLWRLKEGKDDDTQLLLCASDINRGLTDWESVVQAVKRIKEKCPNNLGVGGIMWLPERDGDEDELRYGRYVWVGRMIGNEIFVQDLRV